MMSPVIRSSFVIALLAGALILAACTKMSRLIPTPDHGGTPEILFMATPRASLPTLPPASPTPSVFSARYPTKPVQRTWFYRTPEDGNLELLARYFDIYILSHADVETREILRGARIASPILEYLSFTVIQDPGSCTAEPFHNQAADRPGDFCEIRDKHPDWFLRDLNGNLIYEDPPSAATRDVMMDPGNAEWRTFWLVRARERIEKGGWDGIFVDNAEASLDKRRQLGHLPAAYKDDASYANAVEGFLAYAYSDYFGPRGRPLQANILVVKDSQVWFRFAQFLDGIMDERFAVDWTDYLPPSDWQRGLEFAEATQALGKRAILVAQGRQDERDRQRFAFASYLLVASGRASFRYTKASSYDEIWVYPEDDLDLGQPSGPRYREGAFWKRDFQNGTVSVNPLSHASTITVRRD